MNRGELPRVVGLTRVKEKPGTLIYQLKLRQAKLWQLKIGVRIVNHFTGVTAPDAIFEIVIKAVGLPHSLLRGAVGRFGDTLIHDRELCLGPGLPRLAQIPPETGSVRPPAATDVIIPRSLGRNHSVPRFDLRII